MPLNLDPNDPLAKLKSLTMETPPGADKQIGRFDASVPGQALTETPGNLPSDRPPQYADVEDALDHVMQRLLSMRQAMHMLSLIDAGVPIDFLVKSLVMVGMQEGLWAAPSVYLLTPPLTVLMIRMAQAAKVDYILHATPDDSERIPEMMMRSAQSRISTARVEDAQKAGTQTVKDVRPRTANGGIANIRSFA